MKTVLAHGCFDVAHPGHLDYLLKCRALGDRLVVSVTADRFVNKGPGRPIFPQDQRMAMLAHWDFIDNVMLNDFENAVPIIKALRPAIYAKGQDYARSTPALDAEREAVETIGGRLVIVYQDINYSSTEILTGKLLEERIKRVIPAKEPEAAGHLCKA